MEADAPRLGEIALITRGQAEAADYNLSPSRWVGSASEENGDNLAALISRFEAVLDEEDKLTSELQVALFKLKALA